MTPPRTPNRALRTWRETHGLTRPQMANALNDTPAGQDARLICHPKLIAKWESGEIRWPQAPYRRALHQLTGHNPTALGFISPAPRRRRNQPPTGQATPATGPPATPPTDTDLRAIDDLAALACLLHTRGYTTHLATSLPALTTHHPHAAGPLHITATGPHFHCQGTPFCQRPPATPLALAADAIDTLTHQATTRPQDTPR